MSFDKVGFDESIGENVVKAGRCAGCGACVIACPLNCLMYEDEKPSLTGECNKCGICSHVCPRHKWAQHEVENFVFGRGREADEDFGVYRRLSIARSKDDRVLGVCQDGGVATTLLLFALEGGLVDCAIVSGVSEEKPLHPVPKLALTSDDVLKCAGTRYFYSPNILVLPEAAKRKVRGLAFIGTPCQIRAIRKMQMLGLRKYVAPLKFSLGLMCSECFTYDGLMVGYVSGKLGIDLNDVRKMNIKKRMLITTSSGVKDIPLAEVKQYARKGCGFCDDFSSEFADVSLGGLGLEGWTFVVVRTDVGEEIFSKAEGAGLLSTRSADEGAGSLNLLVKLSKRKRASIVS